MISIFPAAHVVLRHDAPDAAPVIDVVVRIDDRLHRKVALHVLAKELQPRAGRLDRDQHIKDNPAGLAAHDGHRRQVEPPDLVDPGNDLVEPEILVQLRLPEEQGVDAVTGVGGVDEVEPTHVPCRVPRIGRDLPVFHAGDQAARALFEIARVLERKGRASGVENRTSMAGRHLSLGVEKLRLAFAAMQGRGHRLGSWTRPDRPERRWSSPHRTAGKTDSGSGRRPDVGEGLLSHCITRALHTDCDE